MGHASWLQRCWNFKLLEQSAEDATGTFSGYLAAYGNTDENEDRLMPGAFTASLAEYRRAGEMPPMFLNHAGIPWDAVTTESLLPIGVWTDITENSRDLASKGRIDPMDRSRQAYLRRAAQSHGQGPVDWLQGNRLHTR